MVYVEALGPAAFIGRARVVPLRNTGAAISPFNSFLILQGIETLPVRMDRHCENAIKAAEYLRDHPQVVWVKYPALADSPEKPLVDKYMGGRGSSILSFGIKGGREAGARFIDALQLVTRLVNIGDAKSSPAIRPPPPTGNCRRRNWQRPGSARTWCDCPSASSTSTTSSPTWNRR